MTASERAAAVALSSLRASDNEVTESDARHALRVALAQAGWTQPLTPDGLRSIAADLNSLRFFYGAAPWDARREAVRVAFDALALVDDVARAADEAEGGLPF